MQFKATSYFLFLMILNVSCANNSIPDKSNKNSPINCYSYANSGDTIILKLVHIGESITGTLVYKMPKINTSKGIILGRMAGDLLVVRYTPLVDSSVIQEKVFKLIGKYFVEGHGETFNEDSQIRFKSINSVKFIGAIRLVETNCQ